MLKENFYIPNLEASKIYNGNYILKEEDFDGCFVFNWLESRKLQSIAPKDFKFNSKMKKYTTNTLINVQFNKSVKKYNNEKCNYIIKNNKIEKVNGKITGTELSTKNLRELLYNNGFSIKINGKTQKYVRYKRSTAKSRIGNCLFIKEELFKEMISWSRIHLKFEEGEDCELASLLAYESLSLSEGLKDEFITLLPKNILIIPEKYYKTNIKATITKKNDDGTVYQKIDDNYLLDSNTWDGQLLLDKSLCNGKSMCLIRQRLFKGCGLSTNLQQFFVDNNIKEVKDMFGTIRKAKDIKMIITPSCLKFLKFAYKFNSKKECYKYWLDNLKETDYIFGIVKHEQPSRFGKYNQLSYQILNTLDFTNGELQELLEEELKYINLLNTSPSAVKLHLNVNNNISLTNNFIINMLNANPDFSKTKMYSDFLRGNVLKIYKNNLKCGKIKIKNMDYYTMFSNPLEMLYFSIGKDIEPLKGNYVYTPKYKNGEELACFRNPHICKSNVYNAINKKNDELLEYFNINNNVIIVNSKSDIQPRLQGCDFDGDTCLITNNKIIVDSAKKCNEFPTVILDIPYSSNKTKFCVKDIIKTDISISKNYIGEIVNISQVLNSIYAEKAYKKEDLDEIYDYICLCSNLSMLEIDKAKRNYNIDPLKLLNEIRESRFFKKELTKIKRKTIKNSEVELYNKNLTKEEKEKLFYTYSPKPIRPLFLKYAQPSSSSNYYYKYFNCTMDKICKMVNGKKCSHTKKIDIAEILNISSILPATSTKIDITEDLLKEYCIFAYKLNKNLEKSEKYKLLDAKIEEIREKISNLDLCKEEIMEIIYRTFNLKNQNNFWWIRNKTRILSLIFYVYQKEFLSCIKSFSSNKNEFLVEDDFGDIYIWGNTYSKHTA